MDSLARDPPHLCQDALHANMVQTATATGGKQRESPMERRARRFLNVTPIVFI